MWTPSWVRDDALPQSLGCLLYAAAYGHSPFELVGSEAASGSVALAVASGRVRFPANDRCAPYARA